MNKIDCTACNGAKGLPCSRCDGTGQVKAGTGARHLDAQQVRNLVDALHPGTAPAPASAQEGQGGLTNEQIDRLWFEAKGDSTREITRNFARAILARQTAPTVGSVPEADRKMIVRAIIGLRDGWATRKDADDALAALAAAPQEQAASRAAVPDWPDACQWPVGKPFRVLKVGEPGDHTPWQIVMPCGGVLELNHHAEDSVDEARAKWITTALNLPQEDWSSYLKEDETPLARLQREIADNAALSSLLGKARAAVPLSREQVADMLCGPHFTEYGKRQLLNGEFAQVNLSDLTKIANIVLAAPVAQEGKAVDGGERRKCRQCDATTNADNPVELCPGCEAPAAQQDSAECWSCKRPYTAEQRADADGNCPHCGVEIELDEQDSAQVAGKDGAA